MFVSHYIGHTKLLCIFCNFSITGASSFNPLLIRYRGRCWAALRLFCHPEPCSPWEGQWIAHWKTTCWAVCSSAPNSQAAEEAMPHLCEREVQWWLSRIHAVLGKAIPEGQVQMSGMKVMVGADVGDESHSTLQTLRIPSVICPNRSTSAVDFRWTD